MIDLDTLRKTRRVDLGTYDEQFAGVVIELRELLYRERLIFLGLKPGDSEDDEKADGVVGLLNRSILSIEGLSYKGTPITDADKLLELMTVTLGQVIVKALLDTSELSEADAGN